MTSKTVFELKQSIAAHSDVPADSQRLIYSGRVLKDDDRLTQYKIQTGHTIHMVKGLARPQGSSSSTPSGAAPQQLPTMTAGQNPADPLTQLNGPMGHGIMAGFNPFTGLGVNPQDPNFMAQLMESPAFINQMTRMLADPSILDQLIASNPQMAAMGPQMREAFQSEQFRAILQNPEALRAMLQLNAALNRGPGGAGAGGAAGGGLFDLAAAGGAGAGPGLGGPFGPGVLPGLHATPGSPPAAPGSPAATGTPGAVPSPFGNPAALAQLLGGGGGGGLGAGGGFPPGFFTPLVQPPADPRPPEERFQVQLQQLQDMGFTNAAQNVRALLATGGRVDSAIEYILSGGGLN